MNLRIICVITWSGSQKYLRSHNIYAVLHCACLMSMWCSASSYAISGIWAKFVAFIKGFILSVARPYEQEISVKPFWILNEGQLSLHPANRTLHSHAVLLSRFISGGIFNNYLTNSALSKIQNIKHIRLIYFINFGTIKTALCGPSNILGVWKIQQKPFHAEKQAKCRCVDGSAQTRFQNSTRKSHAAACVTVMLYQQCRRGRNVHLITRFLPLSLRWIWRFLSDIIRVRVGSL